jgi:hypothetical protein
VSAFRPPVIAALLLIAAGCSNRPEPLAVQPEPAPFVALPAPPPVTPINRGLSDAASVWHVRVALNVAALACRGPQELAIVADYNAFLAANKPALAAAQAALSAEYRSGGGDWQDRYDDAMTRLYNFFSQAQARQQFCATAAAVLAETRTLAPAAIGAFAGSRLVLLDRPFAETLAPAGGYPVAPVIAAAAPAAPARAVAMPRAAVVAAPPRVSVSAATLGE